MKSGVWIILSFFIFLSCESKCIKNEIPNKINHVVDLQAYDSISFPLDSLTSSIYTASDYDERNGIYSFLADRNILFYDYETRKILKKISVQLKNPTSYSVINKDSILVTDYNDNMIVLMNDDGHIYSRWPINHTIKYFPFPVNKLAPIVLKNDKLFFWGSISGEYEDENECNRRVMGILNVKTNEITYEISYPSCYDRNNMGGGLFRWVYVDYNWHDDFFVISFPADNNVYIKSCEGEKYLSYYAGSKYVDCIKYLKSTKKSPISSADKTKHFVENYSYGNILYDSFRNVYYRIVEMKTQYSGKLGWHKELSIIILNSSFDIIGETFIGKCNLNSRYSLFITEEGLHIPQYGGEEQLIFKIYRLCEK